MSRYFVGLSQSHSTFQKASSIAATIRHPLTNCRRSRTSIFYFESHRLRNKLEVYRTVPGSLRSMFQKASSPAATIREQLTHHQKSRTSKLAVSSLSKRPDIPSHWIEIASHSTWSRPQAAAAEWSSGNAIPLMLHQKSRTSEISHKFCRLRNRVGSSSHCPAPYIKSRLESSDEIQYNAYWQSMEALMQKWKLFLSYYCASEPIYCRIEPGSLHVPKSSSQAATIRPRMIRYQSPGPADSLSYHFEIGPIYRPLNRDCFTFQIIRISSSGNTISLLVHQKSRTSKNVYKFCRLRNKPEVDRTDPLRVLKLQSQALKLRQYDSSVSTLIEIPERANLHVLHFESESRIRPITIAHPYENQSKRTADWC